MNNEEDNKKSLITLGGKGIQLTNFEELYRFSQFVHKSGFAPKGMDSAEKVFLAVQMGMELGISPMMSLQNAAVINGRPGFFGELVVALIQSDHEFEDMITEYVGDGDSYGCSVTIKRRGKTPSVGIFTVRQAKAADLIDNPAKKDTWGKYTDDMLFWRAFSRAKRIFSDKLRGFRMVEDLRDYPEEKVANAIEIKRPELGKPFESPPTKQNFDDLKAEVAKQPSPVQAQVTTESKSESKKKAEYAGAGRELDHAKLVDQIRNMLTDGGFLVVDLMSVLKPYALVTNEKSLNEMSEANLKTVLTNWNVVSAELKQKASV